jgi:hypothetical protein
MNNIADFEKTNPTLPLRLASGLRARTSRLLNHQLKTGLLCLGLTALGTLSALASHFRYGTLSSQWIGPDGQMKFSLSAGYRRDFGSFLPASPKNTPPSHQTLETFFLIRTSMWAQGGMVLFLATTPLAAKSGSG